MLCKERIIRLLYRSEAQWLVFTVQSRALGRRHIAPEMQVRALASKQSHGRMPGSVQGAQSLLWALLLVFSHF